jgi:hypothetical protein
MLGFDPITANATLDLMTITMMESQDTALKEVVIIGYGSRKRLIILQLFVSLKAEEISRTKVLNASQAIQGKAAGVQVVSSDLPGSTPQLLLEV